MIRTIKYFILLLVVLMVCPTLLHAEDSQQLIALQKEFLRLYRTEGHDEEFYRVAEELSQYYKDHNQLNRYYTTQLNICLYDTENDQPYKALKRANNMMEEMEAGHYNAYENVYMALGTVYESRGSYRMAYHFYQETLNYTNPEEFSSLLSIHSRLAYLLMFINPQEAEEWNERCKETAEQYPEYKQVYHVIRAILAFIKNDKETFDEAWADYRELMSIHQLDKFGDAPLRAINLTFIGKYEDALSLIPLCRKDLSIANTYELKALIYERMGNTKEALHTLREKAEVIDSLNSDILFNNMNELSTQAGLGRAKAQTDDARQRTFTVVMLMSFVIIVILAVWLFLYRKNKDRLKEKNEQLRSALAMAEEGEKMKLEFVRSVSHEIRTPLNAISGFNDVLNTPGLELSETERRDMVERVKQNVQAITNIIDEMLRMADKESNEFYPKSGSIYPNSFLSAMLYEHRNKVSGAIELTYTSKVINRFQIETNEEGLRKIMEHLIQNAIKFTSKGFIEVHSELSEDQKLLLVSVKDTGVGVSSEQRKRIFEAFYKANAFQQGIGLGLAVSKKIAKKLGGDLTLDESYTDGACFVLSLPV